MSAEIFLNGRVQLCCGDSMHFLRDQPDNRYDSIVCDPPYALVSIVKRFGEENAAPAKSFGKSNMHDKTFVNPNAKQYVRLTKGFMGKQWDTGETAFSVEFWFECLRVLKPGGHVVAFGGTRTYHRLACAIEDAGFEIRDQLQWLFGSGFPKSHDVSKGIDRIAGRAGHSIVALKQRLVELAASCGKTRKQIDEECGFRATNYLTLPAEGKLFDPWIGVLPAGEKWKKMKSILGGGDDLDEAFAVAEREKLGERKSRDPVAWYGETERGDGIVDITSPATDAAREWQGWGTALKPACEPICLARKPLSEPTVTANVLRWGTGALNIDGCRIHTEGSEAKAYAVKRLKPGATLVREGGNWRPDDENAAEYQGMTKDGRWPANIVHDGSNEVVAAFPESNDSHLIGSAIQARASIGYGGSSVEFETLRHAGQGSAARFFYSAKADSDDRLGSKHPTVKPVDLMQWLVRLVTPKGGLVLDPFAGTGTTAEACCREGMRCVLIEREAEYQADIRRRMALVMSGPDERSRESVKARMNEMPMDDGPLFQWGNEAREAAE